ncbi:hypothetical protein [Microbispora rosea]
MSRPRDIGTMAETAVVRALRVNGFPLAERRSLKGALDQGDITGTPGLCWEVKGGKAAWFASDGQVAEWMRETEVERVNARADIGILVVQRKGIGTPNAGRWWAIMRLVHVAALTHQLGLASPGEGVLGNPAPVRMHLADACTLLRAAGYGKPLVQAVAG